MLQVYFTCNTDHMCIVDVPKCTRSEFLVNMCSVLIYGQPFSSYMWSATVLCDRHMCSVDVVCSWFLCPHYSSMLTTNTGVSRPYQCTYTLLFKIFAECKFHKLLESRLFAFLFAQMHVVN